MTHEEFISIVKNPTTVSGKHVDDLKEMIGFYPYFVQPRLLLAKAACDAKSIYAQIVLRCIVPIGAGCFIIYIPTKM